MKAGHKPNKLTKVKSNPLLKRDESIKQLHLETLSKPKSLLVVHYREKRLSIPIFEECVNGQAFLTKNLIRFEQQILKSKSLDHFRSLVGYRTKDDDVLKDYYFTIGKDISIFKLLELEPIWKTPQQRKGLNNYQFYRCLYHGKATKVYLGRHRSSGKFQALKLIRKDRVTPLKAQIIKNEENALKMINHQFVVKLQDAFQTPKHVVFVMQYCHGGSLKYHINRHQFSELEAKFYVLQLLMALEKVHEMRIIHQEIQPSSVMLDSQGHLKLSGFGHSFYKLLKKGNYKHEGKLHLSTEKQEQGYMLDYYCVGTLCYQLLTGMPPYEKQNSKFPRELDLSIECQSFVKELMESNPNSRLGSLNGVKEVLGHPWLRSSNLQRMVLKVENAPIQPNLFIFYSNQEYEGADQNRGFQKEYESVPEILSLNMDSDEEVMKPMKRSPVKQISKSRNVDKSRNKSRQNGKVVRKTSNKKITINIEIMKKREVETALHNTLSKNRSDGQLVKHKIKRL